MSFLIGPFLLRIFTEKHPFLAVFRPIFGNFGTFPLVFGRGRISKRSFLCLVFPNRVQSFWLVSFLTPYF
jgi:hypothetical protein